MVRRRLDMRSRVSARVPGARGGAGGDGAAGLAGLRGRERRRAGGRSGGAPRAARAAAGAGDGIWPATSFFVMRPASPLPATADRATSCASAILRAVGVAFWPSLASFAAAPRLPARRRRGGRCAFGGRGAAAVGAGFDHRQHVADLHVGPFRVLD